jgi:anti-sigma factor RsiW
MRHGRARRRLPALLDGLLRPAEEAKLNAHLEGCRRCRRTLAEHQAAESLLRAVPAGMLPLAASHDTDGRLQALARWAPPRRSEPPLGWQLPAFGALGATLAVWGMVGLGPSMSTRGTEPSMRALVVAARMPLTFGAVDLVASAAPIPYTLRQ